MTVGSGFTKLASPGMGSFSDRAMFIQYKPASDTSVDMNTFANVDIWSGIALEIKAK